MQRQRATGGEDLLTHRNIGIDLAIDTNGNQDNFNLVDWDFSVHGDAFSGPGDPGKVSATDLGLLDILGWKPLPFRPLR